MCIRAEQNRHGIFIYLKRHNTITTMFSFRDYIHPVKTPITEEVESVTGEVEPEDSDFPKNELTRTIASICICTS